MRRDDVAEQLDYLFWVRDRILAAAAELPPETFRSADTITTRSLRGTLAHQLECEWAWRIRLAVGRFPNGDVLPGDFQTVDELAGRWRRDEAELRAWFAGVSDDDLAAPPPGTGDPLARWRGLLYVVNHGTQQFTEAAVLLTRLGHSPGEIGFLEFCSASGATSGHSSLGS